MVLENSVATAEEAGHLPYKNPEDKRRYDRKRYRRLRNQLINALGGKCKICGGTRGLEVHHLKPYGKRSRPNSKEYFKPEGKELRCKRPCHVHTETWRRRSAT